MQRDAMNNASRQFAARLHYEAATLLHRQGKLEEAERRYRAALQDHPGHPGILHDLGVVYIQGGRLEEATKILRRAAKAAPTDARIRNSLGLSLRRLGRQQEAVVQFEKALALKPDYADALCNLAKNLEALGRNDEALDCYERALALEPGSPFVHNGYGLMLAHQGRHEEAVGHFRKALVLDPSIPVVYSNLAGSLNMLDRPEEALTVLDQAIAIDPKYAKAHCGRGYTMRWLGRTKEARDSFERAIALSPHLFEAHRYLAEAKTFGEGDPQIATLEEMVENEASMPAGERAALHFTLAKAYTDLKRHDLVFAHLKKGNLAWRDHIDYDEAVELGSLHAMAAIFTPELMTTKRGLGDPSEVPVFIVGMPRSGTTLVEQILASHPSVFGANELRDFGDAVAGGYEPGPLPFDVAKLSESDLRRLGGLYLTRVLPRAPQAKRITDKRPDNFRFAGLIHLVLPNARIIHVRRDPLDTCFSCYCLSAPAIFKFAYDLGELGRYYKAYEALMAHWRAILPESALCEVQYETLVEDFEREARRIVAHCGLEWDERCLEFHKTERAVRTASALQVRRPVYRSSIGRWRPYEKFLGPLIEALR